MPSDWPIDGKISKAGRHNYVSPEKKYIDSYYNHKGDNVNDNIANNSNSHDRPPSSARTETIRKNSTEPEDKYHSNNNDNNNNNYHNNNNNNNNNNNYNANNTKNNTNNTHKPKVEKETKVKDSNALEKQAPNESKNTYHCFRYSCGYKANRKCGCLNKFVRMPLWYSVVYAYMHQFSMVLLTKVMLPFCFSKKGFYFYSDFSYF